MGPQPAIIKAGYVGQSVEAPAVRIAGEVTELLQLAEHRERRIGAKHPLEFRQVSDSVAAQVLTEDGGSERGVSHNVIVPTAGSFQ